LQAVAVVRAGVPDPGAGGVLALCATHAFHAAAAAAIAATAADAFNNRRSFSEKARNTRESRRFL